MAYNLKAGLMATTTMVGSAFAYTRTQSVEDESRGPKMGNQNCGLAAKQDSGGLEINQTARPTDQYKDTFDQMMHWKY